MADTGAPAHVKLAAPLGKPGARLHAPPASVYLASVYGEPVAE
jgi:hypothetical protein